MDSGVGGSTALRTFREAVENTGHAVYWTDTNGRIQYVNPAFEAQTGYSADEAVGSNANILESGVHDDRFYEQLWETILNGEVWEGEIVNQRKSGERYVVKQTISPITDDAGNITRFVAANEEVTELRTYQNRLERQRDRFAALLDGVPVPLVLADYDDSGDPVVKQTNDAFRETFGYNGSTIGGSSLDKFIVNDSKAEEARELNEQVQHGEQVRREVVRHTETNDNRTFLLNATPLSYDDQCEVLATYIDITDRKKAEEMLERRTEALEDFASVVSHDLRNPLNIASGHLDLLDDEYDSPHIDPIRNAHERMQELIENILLLAKQGKSVGETERVALDDCVARSWGTIDTGNASLRVETTKTVHADESRLRQLFGNLIRNAVEHGGTDVTVTVGDLDDGFYVEDDGPGIPESERPQVFDTGHTTTKDGTGFGLSIVREIVDAHGWTVTVTDSESGGARFEITDVPTAT
ncbi:PAS domain S-box protein [Salarchaeum japonicum]|uniref:PAS domain S-box protein n=1 Tax=Salarchaeum japonicum TaxID=555573 RepID=UPI003C732F19